MSAEWRRRYTLDFMPVERWLVLSDPEGVAQIVAKDVSLEYGGDIAGQWQAAATLLDERDAATRALRDAQLAADAAIRRAEDITKAAQALDGFLEDGLRTWFTDETCETVGFSAADQRRLEALHDDLRAALRSQESQKPPETMGWGPPVEPPETEDQ